MIATWTPDADYPSRSLALGDAIEAGRAEAARAPAVLLGVDRLGAPVLHYARIEDGGSPSLLLCGHAQDVLEAVDASLVKWYGCRTAHDPTSQRPGLWWLGSYGAQWQDGTTLTITVRRGNAYVTPSRVCACEFYDDMRGSWIYYPRSVPGKGCMPVSFHTVS